MEYKIYSVTVTYNPDLVLLDRQIDSLINQVQCIVLVDNGSSNINDVKKYCEQKKTEQNGQFIFIYNGKNKGLGYAQNVGIKQAIGDGASDVLLLDQDSVLQHDFVLHLIEARADLNKQQIRIGAIGPVYFSEITNQIYPITKFWGPFIKRIKPSTKPVEASFLIASGCLISINVLNDVGLMDEDLFIDGIDVDLSFRARAMGYKLYASPQAIMMHTVGEKRMNIAGRSIAIHSPLRRYYMFRNSVFMVANKNVPVGYKIREIVFNILRIVVYCSVSKDRWKYLKYSISGFKDGLAGKGGECTHEF